MNEIGLSFLISYRIAQEENAPRWNPGDFFAETFRRGTHP